MFRKWHEARNEEGFTLIELLVVVIIIGILAAIAIPAFLNQRERAWESELTSTVRNVAMSLEAEATASAGDYLATVNDALIVSELEAFQGAGTAATGPVTYTAGDFTATQVQFTFCMEHTSLIAANSTNTALVYDSAAGGLQGLSPSCP